MIRSNNFKRYREFSRTQNSLADFFNRYGKVIASLILSAVATTVFAATTPIAAYHLNDTGTTAADQSGNNNSGSLVNGPAWTGGKNGGGLTFDGNNDHVSVGDVAQADGLKSFTISTWVKFQTNGGGAYETHLIDKSQCSGYPNGGPWELGVTITQTHKAEFIIYPQNGSPVSYILSGASTTSVDDGNWHYVTGRYDGSALSIWINGVQENSQSALGITMSTTSYRLEMGGNCNGYSYPFRGTLDDVRIYDRALSASEIQTDMNTPVSGGSSPPPAPDTTPPTAAVTAPVQNAQVSNTITVSATASDNVGVAGVRFLLDNAPLGTEAVTAPYSISWNTTSAPNGVHTLAAIARDAAGNQFTTASISVNVANASAPPPPAPDTTAPTVSLTAPAQNAQVSGTVTVSASASDNVGVVGVRFLLDNAALGVEDTAAPYTTSFDSTLVADGVHTLSAVARDAAGNQRTANAVTVTVANSSPPPPNDTTQPIISMTAPAQNAQVSGTIAVTAGASDNVGVVGVRFLLDSATLGAEDTTAPYSISWNTTLVSNGVHTLSAVARDAAGNQRTASAITITVANDSSAPTPPSSLRTTNVAATSISLAWNSSSDDVGVTGYRIYRNDALAGTTSGTTFTSSNLQPNTAYTFYAHAFDASGKTSLRSSVLDVRTTAAPASDTTAPSVPSGLRTSSATPSQIVIAWNTATDNVGVTGYRVYRNGAYVNATTSTSFSDSALAANTSYTYTVNAYDAAGNSSTQSSPWVASTAPPSSGVSYTTNFDLTENPISEGGRWHRANNSNTNVRTSGGLAYGTNGPANEYDDSYALLSGFGPDQTAEGTIYRSSSLNTGVTHEVELLLRFADDANGARGYEVLFSYYGAIQIVRWNGRMGDYTLIDGSGGPGGLSREFQTGDVVKATITGNVIRVYINGVFMTQATDSAFPTGQPGISFFTRPGGNSANYAFTNYTATSN